MPASHGGWKDVLSSRESIRSYRTYVEGWENKIRSFLEFDPERTVTPERPDAHRTPAAPPMLEGMPFAVKDNIAVKGFHLTCGSKMLENLVSPYTATAVERLIGAGAGVVGKTNLDEFGMGSSTDNSALAVTSNPWDPSRVAGGSSGGSAAAVAAGLVPFALGSDTGGSIRQPASFCGVYGLKPTYGTVSRYGLVAYASSLEVIGALAADVDILQSVFEVMKGLDGLDQTSLDHEPSPDARGKDPASMSVGVLTGDLGLDEVTADAFAACRKRLSELGCRTFDVELPTLDYVVPAYYTIATAEASSNLARFNGIRYGHRTEWAENPDELVRKSRDEGFGDEVKLRILLGTYVLRAGFQDQYYVRAQKIRTAIRNDFDRVFTAADMILMPTFPTVAFKHGDDGLSPFQQKLADKFTASANLAGIPALTFPCGTGDTLPAGMQLVAPAFEEERLFSAARLIRGADPIRRPAGYAEDWRS